MKVVYKYGTGHPIPEGAVYLCTQVETKEEFAAKAIPALRRVRNEFVWHYFLVEKDDETN